MVFADIDCDVSKSGQDYEEENCRQQQPVTGVPPRLAQLLGRAAPAHKQ